MGEPKKKRIVVKKALGPGVHAGVIELRAGASYRVRLTSGEHVRARRDRGVSAEVLDACLAEQRTVLVADGPRAPVILGALAVERRPAEALDLAAEEICLRAGKRLTLQVGRTKIRLDETGAVQIDGRKLVIDVSTLVRFLAASVELP